MNARRRTAVLSTVAAALVLVTSCSSAGTGGESEGTEQVVHFSATDPAEAYETVIADFEELHPDITIEYTQIPFANYNPTLQQRLAANNQVDVYLVEQVNAIQYAAQGFLADQSDLADQVKQVVSEQVYESGVYDDTLYALPMYMSMQLMYYNKTLLEDAGIPLPSIDPEERLTWQQVTADATAAQEAGAQYGLIIQQPTAYYQFEPIVESAGGTAGIGGQDGLELDITTPEWTSVMQWYADLFAAGISPRSIGYGQNDQLFASGSLAYMIGGTWVLPTYAAGTAEWGIAPMPYWEGGTPKTPNISWNIGVNPNSSVREAAQQFMEYAALTKEGSAQMGIGSGNITSNSEGRSDMLAGLEAKAGPNGVGAADLIEYEIENTATLPPASVGFPQFQTEMNLAIGDIVNGSPVEARLEQANTTILDQWKNLQ
ncbi:MAG: sugar ABC transporter substrate-binding protein [Microbacterium sp.]